MNPNPHKSNTQIKANSVCYMFFKKWHCQWHIFIHLPSSKLPFGTMFTDTFILKKIIPHWNDMHILLLERCFSFLFFLLFFKTMMWCRESRAGLPPSVFTIRTDSVMKMSLAQLHAPSFEAVNQITTLNHLQAARSLFFSSSLFKWILLFSLESHARRRPDSLRQDGPGVILSEGHGHTSTQRG